MLVENRFCKDNKCVKIIRMFDDRGKIIVQELELNDTWKPVFNNTYDIREEARMAWVSRILFATYEEGNSSLAPFNPPVKGSLHGRI